MKSVQHDVVIPPELAGYRLDSAVSQMLNQYSRSMLKRWIESGDVLLNDESVRPRTPVCAGDRISVSARLDASDAVTAQVVDFDVAFEDDTIIVVDKPAGLVVHPGAGNPDHTLVNGLLQRYPELTALPRAGLIHRIDKGTSGLLLVARHNDAYHQLVATLAARQITRQYIAVCNGRLISGATIDAPIGRDPRNRKRMWTVNSGRPATTHYRVKKQFARQTLLDVTLETGRTHQIRVHLAAQGNPLLGDSMYGARPMPPPAAGEALRNCIANFARPALHAANLELEHPVSGQRQKFSSEVPTDLAQLIDLLEHHVQTGT